MTVLRCVIALIAVVAGAATAGLLDWPGWSYAPLGVVFAIALTYGAGAHRRDPGPGRVDASMAMLAAGLAVATMVTAITADTDRGSDRVDTSVTGTAAETVRSLFTFSPEDFTAQAAQRRQELLAPSLTGRLLADYRSQGPNVVLPAAVETRASMTTTVQSIGVGESAPDVVRLLVFATEQIIVPSATPPSSTVPIVRWAVMRRVGDTWRLADIYPAGIGG